MKNRLNKKILKAYKKVVLFKPNRVRLSFYINPIEDISNKKHFSVEDLDSIMLANPIEINSGLFDIRNPIIEGNVYTLMDEGVLKNQYTGEDLGIYNYIKIDNGSEKDDYLKHLNKDFVKSNDNYPSFINKDEDLDFSYCILAEDDPLNQTSTQIVKTLKGYLEVTTLDNKYSYIRPGDCTNNEYFIVHIPQSYVSKYQLRNGDEIVCTYRKQGDIYIADLIFSINQVSHISWDVNRPWFKQLKAYKPQNQKGSGDYIKTIINRFGLFSGDSVCLYLNKTSIKSQVLTKLMEELSNAYDKVIYINTNYSSSSLLIEDRYNISKFCTSIDDNVNTQIITVLLAAQHCKRLVEMGKKVALVITDLDAIIDLDKSFAPDSPITKTLLGSIKSTKYGASTGFTIVPLRLNDMSSCTLPGLFKSSETLGIVIENNQIDLFNSYRI